MELQGSNVSMEAHYPEVLGAFPQSSADAVIISLNGL
jgi:hypothetical protein